MIVTLLVVGWQATQDEVFESVSLLAVDAAPSTLAATGGRPENIVFLARRYAVLADSRPVVEAAVERSEMEVTPEAALGRITVNVSTQDATISVRTSGGSPLAASVLNDALVTTLGDTVRDEQLALREERLQPLQSQITQLEARFAELQPGSPQRVAAEEQYQVLVTTLAEAQVEPLDRLQVLSPPTTPTTPVAPRPVRAGILAFVIAAAVGGQVVVGYRLLRGQRRDRRPADVPRTAAAEG